MPETTCRNFFFLQVGVEAEGSGPVWGMDGSGSGDILGNEDLLRVSIRGAECHCWGSEREGCGVRWQVKVDWALGNCWLESVETTIHCPLLCLKFTPHFKQA